MESTMGRTTIFPCFHSIIRLLRQGNLERGFIFEKALAARFVQETKESVGIHRACALAMNAEMKFRSGLPLEALEEFKRMTTFYSPVDSDAVREACGADVCALAYSRSALWHAEMGNKRQARSQCEVVINRLDSPCTKCPREMHAILTPVIAILRETQAGRLKKLYEKHVVKLVRGPMPMFVRNMRLVLGAGDGTEVDEDTSFILDSDNKDVQEEADHLYISLGLSMNTTAAEACLILAQQGEHGTWGIHDNFCEGWSQTLVIDKGLGFATVARQEMKENNHVISEVANARNEAVLAALTKLDGATGHNTGKGPIMRSLNSNVESASNASHSRLQFRRKTIAPLQLKAKKTLPHHLLLSHDTAAFVGLTHDSLGSVFEKSLSEEPRRRWKGIYIFYVSDTMMDNFKPWSRMKFVSEHEGENDDNDSCQKKQASRQELSDLLRERTEELRFFEITHHCSFFGSFFDWRIPGGYIHVSPSIWGVDVKKCPSQNYRWEVGVEPSHDYNAYRNGIENLLSSENPFATPL